MDGSTSLLSSIYLIHQFLQWLEWFEVSVILRSAAPCISEHDSWFLLWHTDKKNSLTESFEISLKRAFQLIHMLVLFFNEINQIKRYGHIWAIFISVECKRTFPERDKLSPLLFHFQSFRSRSRLKRAPLENVQLDFISLLTSGTSSQTGLALCWSTLARSGLPIEILVYT